MNQVDPTKKNLKDLDINLGHLVRSVLGWVGCCVVYDFIYVSRFLLIIQVMVMEGHFLFHTKILVKQVPENVPAMSISFLLH